MESNKKESNRLAWNVTEAQSTVTFPDGGTLTFKYEDIKEYGECRLTSIVASLFAHGLKQKLADCVAGATKAGISFSEQRDVMTEKWEEIRTGMAKARKNAKADPFAEARAKLDAMVDGPEKIAALALAKMLGIVK